MRSDGVMTVSYTHLDVYKRPSQEWAQQPAPEVQVETIVIPGPAVVSPEPMRQGR